MALRSLARGPEFDRCIRWWPSAPNSRGAELQILKPASSSGSKWSRQEDLWTKGCAEREVGAAPPLYNFNLWWMIARERSGGDKYERACPGRSSIMLQLLTFRSCGQKWIPSLCEKYLLENWSVLIKSQQRGWSVCQWKSKLGHMCTWSFCRISMHGFVTDKI